MAISINEALFMNGLVLTIINVLITRVGTRLERLLFSKNLP